MTEEHTELTPESDRPRYEWPVGGLVRIRDDADIAEEDLSLRGEPAVVVGPLGMIVSDLDAGPIWKWVQKVYCPQRREYLFIQPECIAVLGGEPTNQGIRDVFPSTAPLVRAGLARPERDGTAAPRPDSTRPTQGELRRDQRGEGQS